MYIKWVADATHVVLGEFIPIMVLLHGAFAPRHAQRGVL